MRYRKLRQVESLAPIAVFLQTECARCVLPPARRAPGHRRTTALFALQANIVSTAVAFLPTQMEFAKAPMA